MHYLYRFVPGKSLVRVDHVGLANIVAGRRIVPEYLQDEASPENLSAAICRILDDESVARAMRSDLREVRGRLGEPGCTARVARMLLAMTGRTTEH